MKFLSLDDLTRAMNEYGLLGYTVVSHLHYEKSQEVWMRKRLTASVVIMILYNDKEDYDADTINTAVNYPSKNLPLFAPMVIEETE